MKNRTILNITASAFLLAALVTSCNTSSETKLENAEQEVVDANIKLEEANEEYLADIEKYRVETAEKIAANDKSIAEFNARIKDEKKDAKADYEQKIAALEQKNSDMKKKMDDYKAEGKSKWEEFKAEFSRDMDDLGKAFKELTVKSK